MLKNIKIILLLVFGITQCDAMFNVETINAPNGAVLEVTNFDTSQSYKLTRSKAGNELPIDIPNQGTILFTNINPRGLLFKETGIITLTSINGSKKIAVNDNGTTLDLFVQIKLGEDSFTNSYMLQLDVEKIITDSQLLIPSLTAPKANNALWSVGIKITGNGNATIAYLVFLGDPAYYVYTRDFTLLDTKEDALEGTTIEEFGVNRNGVKTVYLTKTSY